jgi:hypothetical protein
MVYRATGKGKVEIYHDSPDIVIARLYNFDFDDFHGFKYRPLKKEHKEFLSKKIIPLTKDDGVVWMEGSASKIGEDPWNMTLSRVRVGAVLDFLLSQGVQLEQMQTQAVGEEKAQEHALDDEKDRAVVIYVRPNYKPHVPEPPPKKVPKASLAFKIAIVAEPTPAQQKAIDQFKRGKWLYDKAANDQFAILIWDQEKGDAALYYYMGMGLVRSKGFDYPKLVNGHGPWSNFNTEKKMNSAQFGRFCRFTSGHIGPVNFTWIYLTTPRSINNVYTQIDSGASNYSASGQISIGDLYRVAIYSSFNEP